MIACKIVHLKGFMSHLLIKESFDAFWLSEASVTTGNTFTIDGMLHPEFFSQEAQEVLKPFCYSIIRGKQTPLQFKFVFRLSYVKMCQALENAGIAIDPEQVDGLFLNVQYQGGALICTTGTSLKVFTMDKSLDQMWDQMVLRFFQKMGIEYEEG